MLWGKEIKRQQTSGSEQKAKGIVNWKCGKAAKTVKKSHEQSVGCEK